MKPTPEEIDAALFGFAEGRHFAWDDSPARIRAATLLWENLTEDQATQLVKRGQFQVKGCITGNSYPVGWAGNPGLVPRSYGPLAAADWILAVKLRIELDERGFREISCCHSPLPVDAYGRVVP